MTTGTETSPPLHKKYEGEDKYNRDRPNLVARQSRHVSASITLNGENDELPYRSKTRQERMPR